MSSARWSSCARSSRPSSTPSTNILNHEGHKRLTKGNTEIKNPSSFLHDHYSTFYFTPGLKVKLLPQLPISPYGFVGVGLAHFHNTDTDQGSYENVIDYGAGLDWSIAPLLSIRGELRDFNSGVPRL